MKSIDDWVENQCSEAAMTDASGMVPSIKSDRAGGPGLNFGVTGSIAYTSHSARFRSLLGMWVAYIMFIVRTCGGSPSVHCCSAPGLLLVVAVQPLVFVFGS